MCKNNLANKNWEKFYKNNAPMLYPTEWVMRTLAGANYPNMKLDKNQYMGAKILDLSTGDGRNLELIFRLGFDISATEISEKLLSNVKSNIPLAYSDFIDFSVAYNHDIPYDDFYFDYILSCSSLYYLEPGISFDNVLDEVCRVLKPSGYLIFSVPTPENSILSNAIKLSENHYAITNDPYQIRNGTNFFAIGSKEKLKSLLTDKFTNISIGREVVDYYGLKISCFYVVCQKKF